MSKKHNTIKLIAGKTHTAIITWMNKRVVICGQVTYTVQKLNGSTAEWMWIHPTLYMHLLIPGCDNFKFLLALSETVVSWNPE